MLTCDAQEKGLDRLWADRELEVLHIGEVLWMVGCTSSSADVTLTTAWAGMDPPPTAAHTCGLGCYYADFPDRGP